MVVEDAAVKELLMHPVFITIDQYRSMHTVLLGEDIANYLCK